MKIKRFNESDEYDDDILIYRITKDEYHDLRKRKIQFDYAKVANEMDKIFNSINNRFFTEKTVGRTLYNGYSRYIDQEYYCLEIDLQAIDDDYFIFFVSYQENNFYFKIDTIDGLNESICDFVTDIIDEEV